ncbi:MAG: Nif3-like dinuclear metal center hexameric protein [Halanaerobium sp.]|nr:Nif3-like dinuclear metal center hexameric protein [Halanaerobium sp.]
MLTVDGICRIIEELAPPALAEEWDNVGLQVGRPDAPVEKVLVTLDVDTRVIEEAVGLGIDLIVAHHPLIFTPQNRITTAEPAGQMIFRLIREDISLYVAHTSLDIASQGLNDWLADKIGLTGLQPLDLIRGLDLYKLAVFVPAGHLEEVQQALFAAGAGQLGNYSEVSFYSRGTGTFTPGEGSAPFIGGEGQAEMVDEYRLEVILQEGLLQDTIQALQEAHPYEEVAYDLYKLANQGPLQGLGRLGRLPRAMEFEELVQLVTEQVEIDYLQAVPVAKQVRKVALCTGSGGSLVSAAIKSGADVLLTGEIKYHQAQEAQQQGLGVIVIGHYASEKIMVDGLGTFLKGRLADEPGVAVFLSNLNTNPLQSR